MRGALAEQLSVTLQHSIDGVLGRIASVEGQQHLNLSNNTALSGEVQVTCWRAVVMSLLNARAAAHIVSCSCWVKQLNKFKRN